MRRDHFTPFDLEAEEAADLTQQFWGGTRGWTSEDVPAVDRATSDDTTGSLRAIRDGFAAFRPQRVDRGIRTGRTRQHGVVDRTAAVPVVADRPREQTLAELATGWDDPVPHRSTERSTGLHAAVHGAGELTGWDDEREGRRGTGAEQHASRTRRHGFVHGPGASPDDMVPLTPVQPLAGRIGLGAVDPLLLRFGVAVLVVVMLVPVALALRPDRAGAQQADSVVIASVDGDVTGVTAPQAAASAVVEPLAAEPSTPATDAPASEAGTADAPSTPAADATAASSGGDKAAAVDESTATPVPVESAGESSAVSARESAAVSATETTSGSATVEAQAERLVPECPQTYEAGAGDSWYRIADAAGVTPGDLMAENRATVDTPIFPGDEICLPAGATVPSPPTTTPSTTPPTTAPPTTAPPTTAPAGPADVERIIRDVWPDDLEERALEIAWRESRHVPTAFNGTCCYGLFQIYYSAHASWLRQFGINTATDLYHARKNTEAAYALYQRAGGWGPWGG